MIFKDLIKKYPWKDVAKNFIRLYPDQLKNLDGYYNTYHELLEKNSKKSNMKIDINFVDNKEPEEQYYDVYGTNGEIDLEFTKKEISWALEFSSFSAWLGYTISEKLLEKMSELDIISHCLFEMTFMGYSDKDIKKEKRKLKKSVQDVESGKVKLYPLDLAEANNDEK